MAWTKAQRKAHSDRIKEMWKRKHAQTQGKGQEKPDTVDLINHPPHYTSGKFETIEVLEDWFATEPLLWNATKYLSRWDKKGGAVENLEKAVWYIQRKIGKLKEE